MKVLICFLGLQRTIAKTYQNLVENCITGSHQYKIVYITWENEDTREFEKIFPLAHIYKIKAIDINLPLFQRWKQGLKPHISWQRTYLDDDISLFRYFQQIYVWKQAAMFLKETKILNDIDIVVRLRTDIMIHGYPVYLYYDIAKINADNYVYFAHEPRHAIDKAHEGCPDYLFFGKPEAVCKTLEIMDYLHKYKHNYLEHRTIWYPEPKWEENIVQPESSLYYATMGEGRKPFYLPISITVCK
jgi:hypothetical protein